MLKTILFVFYARSDWVDEPENGYLSNFDLLVVVSHEKLTNGRRSADPQGGVHGTAAHGHPQLAGDPGQDLQHSTP